MNRKGLWEGYRRQTQQTPVVSFPPSFARTFFSKERRLSEYEADETPYVVQCGRFAGLWTRLVMKHKEQKARRHRLNAVISH